MIRIITGSGFDWQLVGKNTQLLRHSKIAKWLIDRNGNQDSIDWCHKKHHISDYRIGINSVDLSALILIFPEYFIQENSK